MFERNDRIYSDFIEKLNKGICYLCGNTIDSFEKGNFCLHWFTYPKGIKKKHFVYHLNNKEFDFSRIDSYFRWLAHSETPIKNINDLRQQMSENSYLESTIKYKNIEWSISIGNSDLEGHSGSKVGSHPHYHIQMIVDNLPFIRFNDLHIRFTDFNLFNMELLQQNSDRAKWVHSHGQGISILEDEDSLEIIDQNLKITNDDENATFFTSTLILAPEGKSFSGNFLNEAYQKSKKTGKPISHFIQELQPEASMIKIIYPGDGVPEIAKRSGKK
jgi:hypothetical protein